MSCTVERREMLELERKEDLRRCSLRARGPPLPRDAPTASVCMRQRVSHGARRANGAQAQAM